MADDGTGDGPKGIERRRLPRYDAELSVDWSSGETFLFSYITNISEMGIFIRSDDPPKVGTTLSLRFATDEGEPLELEGVVVWINPVRPDGENLNPGMGVRFIHLSAEQRERVVDLVRTVAYLQDEGA
jgi:type IV pilus assembly protein PilZ